MDIYKPNEFAELVGVSVKTLQRWDNDGKLKAYRSPSDRRYYTHRQYMDYMGMEIQNMAKLLFIQEFQRQISHCT